MLCPHPNPIVLPQEPSDSPVTPWLCRTEPLLRHKSSKVRPRKPHPKGDGQGGAAFLKPAHPRRGPGEPQSRARLQPRLRAGPPSPAGSAPGETTKPRQGRGWRDQRAESPGSQPGWTGSCSPSTSSAPSREGGEAEQPQDSPSTAAALSPPLPGSHRASLSPSRPGHRGLFFGRKTDLQLFLFGNSNPILERRRSHRESVSNQLTQVSKHLNHPPAAAHGVPELTGHFTGPGGENRNPSADASPPKNEFYSHCSWAGTSHSSIQHLPAKPAKSCCFRATNAPEGS